MTLDSTGEIPAVDAALGEPGTPLFPQEAWARLDVRDRGSFTDVFSSAPAGWSSTGAARDSRISGSFTATCTSSAPIVSQATA